MLIVFFLIQKLDLIKVRELIVIWILVNHRIFGIHINLILEAAVKNVRVIGNEVVELILGHLMDGLVALPEYMEGILVGHSVLLGKHLIH